jgi:competence protein ComGC
MKPRRSNQRNRALTLTEVMVVVVILVLVVVLLPALTARKRRGNTVSCAGLVGRICIFSREWANDHNDKYPMEISTANGGTMELIAKGDVFWFIREVHVLNDEGHRV